jgi:hypothetical protein
MEEAKENSDIYAKNAVVLLQVNRQSSAKKRSRKQY